MLIRSANNPAMVASWLAATKAGAVVMPYANAQVMNEHLKEISRHVAEGAHALLLCDGAGWHQCGGKLEVPGNITTMLIPPHSPELNPTERRMSGKSQTQPVRYSRLGKL